MKRIRHRSLRLESLETRTLLAVTAGSEAAAAELAAPAETGAETVIDVTYNALRAAINKAADGDTISFSGAGTITITSAIQINKSITIDGGGQVVLQGGGENFLFTFGANATDVTLTGLDLTGGYSTTSGMGGIAAIPDGRGVTLNNCNIYGNTASDADAGEMGGAFVVSGTLNMNNCAVYGNEAVYGGFAYISGRGTDAVINAANCSFYGNSAEAGGVIYNQGGTLSLTNCSVAGNSSEQGAVFNANWLHSQQDDSGEWHSVFEICDTTVTNSIFAYNYSPDGAVADVCEDYATSLVHGGAYTWEMHQKDDTFTKFECAGSIIGLAGGYFTEAPVFDEDGNLTNLDTIDLTIKSDSIAAYAGIGANPAEYTGGGVDGYLTVTTLDDTADGSDGVVSLREALAYAALGTFDGTPTITFADGLSGGTISLSGGQLAIISDVSIEGDNITVDAGGESRVLYLKSYNYQYGIDGNYASIPRTEYMEKVPVHDSTSCIDVSISGVNFTGGAADILSKYTGGAGILALQDVNLSLSDLTVSDSVLRVSSETYNFDGQETMNGGGGLAAILYSNVTLDNVEIRDNSVTQTGDRSSNTMLLGGGVFVGKRSSLTATGSVVSGNEITSEYYQNSGETQWGYGKGWGGGICAYFAKPAGAISLTNCEVSDNSITGGAAQQCGGGIYYYGLYDTQFFNAGNDYTMVVASTSVIGNSVGDNQVENNGFCWGAGIFTSGTALLVNDLIAENRTDAGNDSVSLTGDLGGAGIYNRSLYDYRARYYNIPQLDIYYCTITNNILGCVTTEDISEWGGGIQSLGSSTETSAGDACAATVNLVGSIQFHNYVQNSGTGEKLNSDSYNGSDSTLNMSNTLYNNSGIKGTGYNYSDDCIKYLARYKVFNDEANGDYTPWAGSANSSQALDALTDEAPVPPSEYTPAYDIRNDPYLRVYGTAQDLGCYEYQPEPDPSFELVLTGWTGTYDGEAHSITVSGVEDGDVITYSADGTDYSTDVISYTDAGTYTIYVKASREGYSDYSGSAEVTISAKALTVSGTSVADKAYDGTTEAAVTLGAVDGIVDGDDVTVTASSEFPSAEVGDYTLTVTYALSGAAAGNYTAPADETVSASITEQGGEQLDAPVITTGSRGVYVSYGANRHYIQWGAVENASGYELQYTTDGSSWTSVEASELGAVVTGLTYGSDVTYRVRALGSGSYTDSDWSDTEEFNVCPMDINNDGDISGGDRTLLSNSWLAEEGDDEYRYYADINGDGDVSNGDRTYISSNWLCEAGEEDLSYPRPLAADAAFAAYASGDLDIDLDVF